MKKVMIALCLIFQTFFCFGEVEVTNDQLSETLGHLIVRHLIHPGFQFNLDRVVQGIQDERANRPSPLSEEQYEQAICAIEEEHFRETSDKNLSAATTFLEANSRLHGIHVLNEKLQYKVEQEGEGPQVVASSVPLIYYKGSLLDGRKFASSEKPGMPVSLPMAQAISGFSQGMLGMREGERRILYIHPELAYGVTGELPPNSLLIFEVEVVRVNSTEDDAFSGLFGPNEG